MNDEQTAPHDGVVFVFSGHGAQWSGMALDLLDASPLFAKHMQDCEEALRPHIGWSLLDVLRRMPRARRLERVDVVQPALFAVTVSLAELWRACGVKPAAVMGHSQGEIAAAYLAGGLSLADAATVVARRSRALVPLSGRGGMLALGLGPNRLASHVESLSEWVEVGALNGPRSLAVAGERPRLDELLASCKASGVRAGRVAIDYASHSRQIEPLRAELLEALSGLTPRSGEIPFFSTVTGARMDTAECDGEHWYRGERQAVQFELAMRALLDRGHRTFVEIGPHPVLAAAMQETVDDVLGERVDVLVASSLRRDRGDASRFYDSLADVFAHRGDFDWEAAAALLGIDARSEATVAVQAGTRGARATPVGAPRIGALAPGGAYAASLGVAIRELAPAEQARTVREAIFGEIGSTLGVDAVDGVMAGRAFKELGLDSAGIVELRNRLRALTGLALPSTLVFDHPTPSALAAHLFAELAATVAGRPAAGGTQALDPGRQALATRGRLSAYSTSPGPGSNMDAQEPIAIVGMSCRFPGGVDSPQELWELLARGGDAISDFPTDRGWDLDALYDADPDRAGKTYAREGGFLYDMADFDAAFFGISPREAAAMDPQQRLFLEGCWEALESAGFDVKSLSGSQTGVYAGINTLDYNARAWLNPEGLEGHNMTGAIGSVIAGRVSYALGLQGPSLSLDTACSSSLVALHLACGALRKGECSMALAGGVSVMVSPGLFVAFSRQRALAGDARCKSFAQAADGTSWGEGVGVLVLEKLADAQRNGHRVIAVVRGSAVNQDGASNGLAAPNGLAQQQVIRQALASAGLSAADVDAVEAHGTGTRLGDPIEAHALLATYGQQRPYGCPLWLGSIKSNIGHTQAAGGVAGVIKMAMAMRHGVLPRTLHLDEPSHEVDWSRGDVVLLTEAVDWPQSERPRRAAVSSFGISGTNAHAILEQAPAEVEVRPLESSRSGSSGHFCWALSARSDRALLDQGARLESVLASVENLGARDVGLSLARRSAFEHRAVVVGESMVRMREGVAALARGEATPELVSGVASSGTTRVAFMFTGQGAQRAGMGAELYGSLPVFAETFEQVCAHMDEHLGRSLREVVFEPVSGERSGTDPALLDETLFTQAGLFALEVSLYRLLEAWGVKPDFLIGHSIGELVAAYVADVYSLTDACRLVAARGRLMGELPSGGAMVAIQASERELVETLADTEGRIALAGINGPRSVVVSGERDSVLAVASMWRDRGRKTRRLRVSHAFHSPLMEGMLDEFRRVAEAVSFAPPAIPLVSNLTGEPLSRELCSADYWVRQVCAPVRFADGASWLCDQGVASFLEVGPDGVLSAMVQECAQESAATREQDTRPSSVAFGGFGGEPIAVEASAVMRAGRGEVTTLFAALARIWTKGVEVDWARTYEGSGSRLVSLPTYAFQRERFWLDSIDSQAADAHASGQTTVDHPLLGAAIGLADDQGWLFTGRLTLRGQAWLADHVVLGKALLPGTAFLELALYAGRQLGCPIVRELTLQSPLGLPEDGAVQLQLILGALEEGGGRSVSIYSRAEHASDEPQPEWVCHAHGSLVPAMPDGDSDGARPLSGMDDVWPPSGAERVELDDLYESLLERGLDYGPVFRGLTNAWRRDGEIFAEAVLTDAERERAGAFELHPALLDAALHATTLGRRSSPTELSDGEQSAADSAEEVWLPFCFSEVELLAGGATALRVRFSPAEGDALRIALADQRGRSLGSVGGFVLRSVSAAGIASVAADRDGLFQLDWRPVPTGQDDAQDVVLLDCTGLTEDLPAGAHGAVLRVLGALQERLEQEETRDSQFAILTSGAVAVGAAEDVADLAGAAVWGLVRTAQSEHPGRILLVDVDRAPSSREALGVALASGESRLAIRDGHCLAARLIRVGDDGVLVPPPGESAWRLQASGENTFEGLALVACDEDERPLDAGEVRVEVRAAGVNFKDVLIALGVYPGKASIGNEAAGVVLEVGADVRDLGPGDRVTGLFSGAFGPVAITDRRLLAPVPAHWSFAQAASMPLVFLTAYYALVDLAAIRPHERLLLHAATGGVGTAALQLARHLDVEVFATASTEKWSVLQQAGLDSGHVASSRDLGFRERFLEQTAGAGVDVVLNSLAGEFVDASLDLLPRGGRFAEMGKTDVRDAAEVAEQHDGVLYRAFDLMDAGPDRIQEMLTSLLELFAEGALTLPPIRAWDVRRAPQALRFMSQARHVGKLVLTMPARALGARGTVLITGGTGGLGSVLARHLVVQHGVRHLLLASRGGERAPDAEQLREELKELGASVTLASCDVSRREQVSALLASIPEEQPLRVVVHAAGLLDDGLIGSLTSERIERVLAPKLDAAWHLHELTADMDLDAFVLFSSVAAVLGWSGQGNYAAANSFLDALASHRRALGLPAVAMAWGPWDQSVGMTSALGPADLARMASSGMLTLPHAKALKLFDLALDGEGGPLVLARLDSAALRARARAGELPSVFDGLIQRPVREREPASTLAGSFAERLAHSPFAERERIVHQFVLAQTASVLGHASADAVDAAMSFSDLGFDSLASVELRNRLGAAVGMQLPVTLAFDHPTPGALASYLHEQLSMEPPETLPNVEFDFEELATMLSSLSAERALETGIAARLREVLSSWMVSPEAIDGESPSNERSSADAPHRDDAPFSTSGELGDDELSAAADEQIFELIDREFGVS
jgi:acyl transferase domain-containing protein/NADPH:quinone reductase-like Zn-dependent oxidoreductase